MGMVLSQEFILIVADVSMDQVTKNKLTENRKD